MAEIEPFCIDRYEAHLVHRDAPENVHSPFKRPREEREYTARSTAGVIPQAYLSRHQAESACRNAGKRLCRAEEWLRACGGSRNYVYPYGNLRVGGRCNTHKGHVLGKVFGRNTHFTKHHYNNPLVNQEPGFLARTGEYGECRNEHEAMDMVGNLHEWVADPVSNSLTKRIPMPYGKHLMGKRGSGVFMGGYYSSKGEHGKGCRYITTSHGPDYHDYSIGFRCCRDLDATP